MFAPPRLPVMPASLAAIVMLAGLALVYWSLSSFGAFQVADDDAGSPQSGATGAVGGGGGFSGGTSGDGGGGAGGGF